MTSFLEKLDNASERSQGLVCVGLDPDIRKIPRHLQSSENPIRDFLLAIVEATGDVVQSYKLNLAFFEAMGRKGYDTLQEIIAAIPPHVLKIGDGKRGDIGNTSAMYATALFDELGFDAVTVAPYMGYDSLQPFFAHKDKGTFVLALTSNPGSKDFQYLPVNGEPLYKHTVRKVAEWNTDGTCGLVVGATHPSELAEIRAMVPEMPLLIPGLGAQGGDLEAAVSAGITASGTRAVLNSSRAILYADGGEQFAKAARNAAMEFRAAINEARKEAVGA